jgi:Flp pilus assembly pilin Flp
MTVKTTTSVMKETGQTMVEYAVVLTLVVTVTLATYMTLGDTVASALDAVRSILS